jgi:hypothetical protein
MSFLAICLLLCNIWMGEAQLSGLKKAFPETARLASSEIGNTKACM